MTMKFASDELNSLMLSLAQPCPPPYSPGLQFLDNLDTCESDFIRVNSNNYMIYTRRKLRTNV